MIEVESQLRTAAKTSTVMPSMTERFTHRYTGGSGELLPKRRRRKGK